MRLVSVIRRAAFVAGVAATTGCLPLITHTPRVERGFRVRGTETLSLGRLRAVDDSAPRISPIPSFSFRGSIGFRDRLAADGFGAEVGLDASIFNGATLDLYVQAPTRWTGETDAGIGVAGVAGLYSGPMAYVQVGRRLGAHTYLFTTQSLSLVRHSRDAGRPLRWQPVIAIQPFEGDERSRFFFVGGSVGPAHTRCREFLPCDYSIFNPPPALLVVGFSGVMRP